jgi:hypothetical protein
VGKNFAIGNITWDIYGAHPLDIKYPFVVLRCRFPQVLKWVKFPGNTCTFDLNHKCTRTLLLRILQEILMEFPPHLVVENWHLAVGLRCKRLLQYLWFKPQLSKNFAVMNFTGNIYITHHTISKLAFDTLKYRMPCISVSFYSALTLSKSTKEVFDLRRA